MHVVWQFKLTRMPDAAVVMKPEDININPKLLVEQDPEFEAYIKEILLKTLLIDIDSDVLQMLVTLHSFYNAGMDVSDVVAWHRNIIAIKHELQSQDDGL